VITGDNTSLPPPTAPSLSRLRKRLGRQLLRHTCRMKDERPAKTVMPGMLRGDRPRQTWSTDVLCGPTVWNKLPQDLRSTDI